MKTHQSDMKTKVKVAVTRWITRAAIIFGLTALASSATMGATIADPAISFISSSDSGGTFLSVMNADGSNVKKLLAGDISLSRADWSPDGQWLTFLKGGINIISKNGGTPALLTTNANGGAPVWSPLGDRIAYLWEGYINTEWIYDVRAIPAGGGPVQVLHRFQYPLATLGAPSWSPNATQLALPIYDYSLTTPNKSNLSILDLGTGLVVDVTHPLGFDWVANGTGLWARHSNRVAFRGAKVGEAPAMWILDLDVMQARKLADSTISASSWSPDDSKLVFTKSGQLWTVDVATEVQALLAKPPVAKNAHFQESYSAPDWRRY